MNITVILMALVIGFLTGIISTVALALRLEYKADVARIAARYRPTA